MEKYAFGKRLEELMDENKGIKITQTMLGNELGLTRQAISSYVSGASYPPYDKLIQIADFFDVSTDFLLGKSTARSTDDRMKISCAFTGLSEETIKMIKDSKTIFENNPDYYERTQGFDIPLSKILNVLYKNKFMTDLGKAFGCFLYHIIISNNQWFENRHTRNTEQRERVLIPAMWNLNKEISNIVEDVIEPLFDELEDYYIGNADLEEIE